jgi:hypothetical protein
MADSTTKALVTVMIIIGIIILILFVTNPRRGISMYSYNRALSANVYDAYPDTFNATGVASSQNAFYSIHRYVPPRPVYVQTYATPRTYSYYSNTSYEYQQPSYRVYPEGCDATTVYSATTGQSCGVMY